MNQFDLGYEVVNLFKDLDEVQVVFFRGSLAEGVVDPYSDIDIGIDVSGSDNAAFTQTIIHRMQAHFDLHFYDWATSLLPDSYVLTFFIKHTPAFWNIDFDCTATPHVATLHRDDVRATLNKTAHTLKAWVHMAKYYIRQQDGIEDQIRRRGEQWLPGQDTSDLSPSQIMKAILDHLHRQAGGEFSGFFEACYEMYAREIA